MKPYQLPQSYWVIPGCFLAGEHPARTDLSGTQRSILALLSVGCDTFIDLTSPDDLPSYQDILSMLAESHGRLVTYRRFPIDDFEVPSHAQMTAILNAIDSSLAQNHIIYLHCWGGIGRTGTTVGCYLVRHGMSGKEALAQLSEWWRTVPKSINFPRSPETLAQQNFILSWNELA